MAATAGSQPGRSQKLHLDSLLGCRDPHIWAVFCFLGALGSAAAGLEPALTRDAGMAGPTHCATAPAPQVTSTSNI